MRRRPSLRAKSSSIEGMEPVGSSSVMRSTRVIGKRKSGDADAFAVRFVELTDEMIEGIQVDAAHGDSRSADHEQLAPNLFFRAVQAHNDNGMRIHDWTLYVLFQLTKNKFRA